MPDFKPQVREYKGVKKVNIKIRVSHKGKTRYIATSYYVSPGQFNNTEGRINPKKHNNAAFLNTKINNIVAGYIKRCEYIENSVQHISINDLVKYLKQNDYDYKNIFAYADEVTAALRKQNRIQYAESIENTFNKIEKYIGCRILSFSLINAEWLTGFEMWCKTIPPKEEQKSKKKTSSTNTIGIYMRNIRMIINKAIDEGLVSYDVYPFRRYKIKKQLTVHRDVQLNNFIKIIRTDVNESINNGVIARDLFLLSFYLVGMNYKDILLCKNNQVLNGRIYYNRFKTGREYSIKIEPEAQEIINRYKGSEYMVCFYENKAKNNDRKTEMYGDIVRYYNRKLKKVAENLKIEKISTYYARHTWATIAAKIDIPKDIIRLALGHGEKTVTDIYINYDISKVDKANRQVIDYINGYLN